MTTLTDPAGLVGQLEAFILASDFPCLGARSSVRQGQFRGRTYAHLDSDDAELERLAADVRAFVDEHSEPRSTYAVLAVIESAVAVSSEDSFETYLWSVLSRLHAIDESPWDTNYSEDPSDPDFKFSFAGRAFYIVGLAPVSSRRGRRFECPTLVFNPVWQFELLREKERLDTLIEHTRARDARVQGGINPNLRFEGRLSDALQYSGKAVDENWSCPFRSGERGEPG